MAGGRGGRFAMRDLRLSSALALLVTIIVLSVSSPAAASSFANSFANSFLVRTLDGHDNNLRHNDWGRANTLYLRVAAPNYADRVSVMNGGPSVRHVSNRGVTQTAQTIFSQH